VNCTIGKDFVFYELNQNNINMENNILGWFEIPVKDMERAMKFYESVFEFKMQRQKMEALDMAWFPWQEDVPGAPGSLVYHEEFYTPSDKYGVLIYLTTPSGNLNQDLGKVEKAGGKVLIPRTQISDEHGFMAVFLDSEGNRIALHSRT
jgi:predicted enzyme related to lactoylglutathione lyase